MWWDALLDPFRGKAVTIPPMDGAFRPNTRLEAAEAFVEVSHPEALLVHEGRLLVASGTDLLAVPLEGGAPTPLRRFETAISALAALPDGGLAVGLVAGEVRLFGGRFDGRVITEVAGRRIHAPTALATTGEGVLYIAVGSARFGADDWQSDLMAQGASGAVLRLDLIEGDGRILADGLAWPAGLLVEPDRSLIVSEASHHRLLRITGDGRSKPQPVLSNLPGYPSRLTRAAGGGAWLALMAPRNRLVELVLTERAYREDMMATIPRELWIAPQMSSGNSFLEPLQCGGVVTMGVRKPWAPGRSYGLIARLDDHFRPVSSLHSRADGRRHGIRDMAEIGGVLFAASRGGNAVLEIETGAA
jgi:sugar lactone lactonase YvrE